MIIHSGVTVSSIGVLRQSGEKQFQQVRLLPLAEFTYNAEKHKAMGMHPEKKISVPTETDVRCVESVGKNLRFQFGVDRQLACQ